MFIIIRMSSPFEKTIVPTNSFLQFERKCSPNKKSCMQNETCRLFLLTESDLNKQLSIAFSKNESYNSLVNSIGGKTDFDRMVKHRLPLMESIVPMLLVFKNRWSAEEREKITNSIERFKRNQERVLKVINTRRKENDL